MLDKEEVKKKKRFIVKGALRNFSTLKLEFIPNIHYLLMGRTLQLSTQRPLAGLV